MSTTDSPASPAAATISRADGWLTVDGQALAVRWLTPSDHRQAPVIVFLHDALGSIGQWRDFPDRLCALARLRGLVFDRPGHGASPPFGGPHAVDYLRRQGEQQLPALLAAAEIDRPVLFGHSDGGQQRGQLLLPLPAQVIDGVR